MPANSVTMPMGISASPMLRAMPSASSRNIAPMSALAGSSARLFGPVTSRAMCGTISPIQPITPAIDTVSAETMVASAMMP